LYPHTQPVADPGFTKRGQRRGAAGTEGVGCGEGCPPLGEEFGRKNRF